MDIQKSINACMEHHKESKAWLAAQLGVSRQRVDALLLQENVNSVMLRKLANVFGIRVSEFIALGEPGKPIKQNVKKPT